MRNEQYWRIALTEAGLDNPGSLLVSQMIPVPRMPSFSDHSEAREQMTGGASRHGYMSFSLMWVGLTSLAAMWIREMVEAAETAAGTEGKGTLFATIPRLDAKRTYPWSDVSGIVRMPAWTPAGSQPGSGYTSVILSFNNVTVVNEQSTIIGGP